MPGGRPRTPMVQEMRLQTGMPARSALKVSQLETRARDGPVQHFSVLQADYPSITEQNSGPIITGVPCPGLMDSPAPWHDGPQTSLAIAAGQCCRHCSCCPPCTGSAMVRRSQARHCRADDHIPEEREDRPKGKPARPRCFAAAVHAGGDHPEPRRPGRAGEKRVPGQPTIGDAPDRGDDDRGGRLRSTWPRWLAGGSRSSGAR